MGVQKKKAMKIGLIMVKECGAHLGHKTKVMKREEKSGKNEKGII